MIHIIGGAVVGAIIGAVFKTVSDKPKVSDAGDGSADGKGATVKPVAPLIQDLPKGAESPASKS